MTKQLIEVDVPEGFEVDGEAYVSGGYGFSGEMKAMFLEVPLRRKLSYEGTPELAKALREAPDDGFTVLLDPDYIERYSVDYWCRSDVLDLGMLTLRRPHFLLSKGERWPWVDCDDPIAVTVRHVERFGARTIPLYLKTAILTASAQPSPPEPVPIESDLSEQVTRLLRHLGIERPPTSDEVEDMLSQTLRSIAPVKWADISKELPLIKEIPLGDGKSVRVSGEIKYKLSDGDLQELVDATMSDLRRMFPNGVTPVGWIDPGSDGDGEWQWPEWLNKEWLFLTQRGVWMAGNDEPELRDGDWWIKAFSGTWEAMSPDFVPPPCTDWRQSKRRNPQWKD